jgi:hypothetical protein
MRLTERNTSSSDVAYSAFYAGAIGGSAIALFFLVRDVVIGAPLATPSALGTAVFTGSVPALTSEVSLEFVALFSILHFVAFGMLSTLFALLLGRIDELQHRPVVLAAGIFATMTAGIGLVDYLFLPGLIGMLNPIALGFANALTAIAMAGQYNYAFNESAAPVHEAPAREEPATARRR